jgi:hypothetical protein
MRSWVYPSRTVTCCVLRVFKVAPSCNKDEKFFLRNVPRSQHFTLYETSEAAVREVGHRWVSC